MIIFCVIIFTEGDLLDCMAEAVENADVILACISQKYQKSKNCKTGRKNEH